MVPALKRGRTMPYDGYFILEMYKGMGLVSSLLILYLNLNHTMD